MLHLRELIPMIVTFLVVGAVSARVLDRRDPPAHTGCLAEQKWAARFCAFGSEPRKFHEQCTAAVDERGCDVHAHLGVGLDDEVQSAAAWTGHARLDGEHFFTYFCPEQSACIDWRDVQGDAHIACAPVDAAKGPRLQRSASSLWRDSALVVRPYYGDARDDGKDDHVCHYSDASSTAKRRKQHCDTSICQVSKQCTFREDDNEDDPPGPALQGLCASPSTGTPASCGRRHR